MVTTTAEWKRYTARTMIYVALLALTAFFLVPVYLVIVTAFKTNYQIQQIQSMFWPSPWTLDHFRYLFTQIPFVNWYWNTIVVTAVSVTVSVLASALGAYGLVRLRWRGSVSVSGVHGRSRGHQAGTARRYSAYSSP